MQQQVLPRVSVEVGYARRWFQGFTVTDNLNRDPSQYDAWTINGADRFAPAGRRRLPDHALHADRRRRRRIAAQNYITFETDFGAERTNYWHGVDFTLNARLRRA